MPRTKTAGGRTPDRLEDFGPYAEALARRKEAVRQIREIEEPERRRDRDLIRLREAAMEVNLATGRPYAYGREQPIDEMPPARPTDPFRAWIYDCIQCGIAGKPFPPRPVPEPGPIGRSKLEVIRDLKAEKARAEDDMRRARDEFTDARLAEVEPERLEILHRIGAALEELAAAFSDLAALRARLLASGVKVSKARWPVPKWFRGSYWVMNSPTPIPSTCDRAVNRIRHFASTLEPE